jgi:flagellar motor switch protein FliG
VELTLKNIKGREKAAILLSTIGVDGAARVLQELSRDEIEALAAEISELSKVKPDLVNQILGLAFETNLGFESFAQGGVDYAREVLLKALEPERAEAVLSKVKQKSEQRPFKIIERVDFVQLVNFLQGEHPQTVALILAHLDPRQSAPILLELSEDARAEIAYRIATLGSVTPEIIKSIEAKLSDRLSASVEVSKMYGGVELVAKILQYAGTAAENQILEDFAALDPDVAQDIRDRMFTFDDLVLLDDRSVQTLLREVDSKMLALALKACSNEVRDLIFKNMSKRAAEGLREEMEFMGPVRVSDVGDAHRKILDVVRRLEAEGTIYISGKGSDDEIIA